MVENGKSMGTMTQYEGIDPYADKVCNEKKKTIQSWIAAKNNDHMFRATPVDAKSRIEIRVTDRFGNVYIQRLSK